MSIKYSEISDSGISESDFNKIYSATGGHTKSIQIYRQNPKFIFHSNTVVDQNAIWDVASNDDFIVIFYHYDATTIHLTFLAKEDDDNPGSLNSWSDLHWGGCDIDSPLCVTTDGTLFYVYYFSGGILRKGSTDTVSNISLTPPSSYSFSGVEWIDVAEDAFGSTIYTVIRDDQNNHLVKLVQDTYIEDLGIAWPEEMTGFSVYSFSEGSDDTTLDFPNTDIRHCLAISTALPKLYSEKIINGQPNEVPIDTGGVISYVVRPRNGSRNPQVSYYSEVQTFDEVSAVQYRNTVKLSAANNLLWAASVGQNGDLNGTDPVFGFEGLYFYSSADGKNWSQDQIIPIDDIVLDFAQYDKGVQLIVLGKYVYAIANNVILRSLGCGLFGNVHSTLSLDVTNKVNSFSTTASDFRQTTLNLDNEDGYFYGTFLMNPGRYRMITKIGAYVKGTNYLFQTSLEDIDSIEDPRERPRQLRITSRDAMALMTDRTASVDAIQYDNITIGKDTFDPIGNATDSGLSHSDVVSGTWGTLDKAVTGATFNILYCKSKFVNSVNFSTYKTSVADGSATAAFNFPNPTLYVDTPTFANAPTYAGVVFRGMDKDNYWFCRYNYWEGSVELGERRNGVDNVRTAYIPTSGFIANANAGGYVGLHIEFHASQVIVWACEDTASSAQYDFLFEYFTKGASYAFPVMGQGYTGMLACGYSDADVEEPEPDPVIISIGDTAWGSENDYFPRQGMALSNGGVVVQFGGLGGSIVIRNISPSGSFGPDVGEIGCFMITNPYAYNQIVVAWRKHIAMLTDFNTCPEYPSAPWSVKYTAPSTWIILYVLRGSINRQDYYIWWESNGANFGTPLPCRVAITFDNFTTIHYNYLDGYLGGSFAPLFAYLNGMAVGSYNTNSDGLVVVSTSTHSILLKNRNWGLGDWDLIPNSAGIGTPVTGFAGLIGEPEIPYSNADGSENRDQNYIAYYAGDGGSPVSLLRTMNPDGTIVYSPHVAGDLNQQANLPGSMNSLTVRGNRRYASTAGHLWRTDNLGASWVKISDGHPQGINGWPTNGDFLVTVDQSYTTDAGNTWHGFNLGIGALRVITMDLSAVYDNGGVH